jgi:energy-coupling factor transport system substrate-specific component
MRPFATCDDVAASLRALRASAGQPSFGEIATRIGHARTAAGMAAEAARPGRTTIYDVFRDGRRRVDAKLINEIVRALGVDELGAQEWEAECRRIGGGPPSATVLPRLTHSRLIQIPPFPAQARDVVVVLTACVLVNLVGRFVVSSLEVPLHLDMIGTAIGAFVLGPWWGALAGVLTNVAGVGVTGATSIPFALVQIAGALVWGYGVRGRWGETLTGYFALTMGVALTCTLVAAPILLVMFGGEIGHASDTTTDRILALTHSMLLSVASSNLLVSLADKLISGFLALATVETMAGRRKA